MTTSASRPEYDAVVLAGGRSRRMSVADKTRVPVAGVPLLDRTLDALHGADRIVVVGDPRLTAVEVAWTREEPTGGGPAAAVAAGLVHVSADVVVLLAGDLPLIARSDLDRLVDGLAGDGAVYVDDAGHEQWLCSAWRSASLRNVSLVAGVALREALEHLEFAHLPAPVSVLDCDTPEDLVRAEERLT